MLKSLLFHPAFRSRLFCYDPHFKIRERQSLSKESENLEKLNDDNKL
jgi:hypothetical protein